MRGAYKHFDQKLFNQNDFPARSRVLDYISSHGLYAIQNDDKYGPDLVIYKGFRPSYYVEVEVKRVWKGSQGYFPWDTIQIPERKGKFLNMGLPIEFFILRADLEMAVIIDGATIEKSPLVEVPNKLITAGEKFYQVPTTECNIAHLHAIDLLTVIE